MFGEFEDFDLSIRERVKKCHQEYEAIRKNINKQPSYVVDWELVDKAWRTAVKHHCRVEHNENLFRKAGDLYITHPKAVMEELVKLRCKSSVLAAALLHDTMEDRSMSYEALREGFSYEVAQIVSAVTSLKIKEKEVEPFYPNISDTKKQELLEQLTNPRLMSFPFQREALLVRFADRAHNLQTIAACGTATRLEKVASTKAFFIPAARKLGMRYFEVLLNDLCMKNEGEDITRNESAQLLEKRNALTKLSSRAYTNFDQIFHEAIAGQSFFSLPVFNPYAKLRGAYKDGGEKMRTVGRRVMLVYELKQQLERAVYFERSRLDLWETILTCQEQDSHKILENFLNLYKTSLKDRGIYLEYLGQEGDSLVLRLSDRVANNYRMVLIPETKLEAYFIGEHEGTRMTMIDEEAPSDALRPQITVYSFSPTRGTRKYEKCVPYGATALDFAFIIHKELGIAAKGARIRKWAEDEEMHFSESDYLYPLSTVLSEDDVVYLDADYVRNGQELVYSKANVNFNSMLEVNTQYGKSCLIEHFQNKYKEDNEPPLENRRV